MNISLPQVSIRLRLFMMTILLGAMMAVVVVLALYSVSRLESNFHNAVDVVESKVVAAFELKEHLREVSDAEQNLILTDSIGEVSKFQSRVRTKLEEIETGVDELLPKLNPSERDRLAEFLALLKRWRELHVRIDALAMNSLDSVGNQSAQSRAIDRNAYQLSLKEGRPLIQKCVRILRKVIRENLKQMKLRGVEVNQTNLNIRISFILVGLAAIFFGLLLSYQIGQSVARDLQKLTKYADRVRRKGDLTKPVPQLKEDEIGNLAKSFEHMRLKLLDVEERLVESNKELSERNAEMEQFVYTVSHDLKSPLVTCTGFVGLLREDLEAGNMEDVVDSADRIHSACARMSTIIDELLELSRIGRDAANVQPVEVAPLVQGVLERMQDRIERAELSVEVESDLPIVNADLLSVERAFENLISNAIKYGSSRPEPKVRIGARVENGFTAYFVEDNGKGIAEEYHKKIFGLFQRLETEIDGTGVGLAAVAKIMQAHGGDAFVESSPGNGAKFILRFPERSNYAASGVV